jgi:5-formyltetrahydrofolate cyclo-ligase
VTTETAPTKAEIRASALARRDALDPALRSGYSRLILHRILAMDEFRRAQTVLAYSSFGSELETEPFLAGALDAGKRLLLPRINRAAGRLDVYEVKDIATDLFSGVWGIMEPHAESCAPCAAADVEFILVPGAAFDRRGGRIGYGRGYYDILLASCLAARTVAGAFEVQVVDSVPMESHDVRVDALATEAGVWSAA